MASKSISMHNIPLYMYIYICKKIISYYTHHLQLIVTIKMCQFLLSLKYHCSVMLTFVQCILSIELCVGLCDSQAWLCVTVSASSINKAPFFLCNFSVYVIAKSIRGVFHKLSSVVVIISIIVAVLHGCSCK